MLRVVQLSRKLGGVRVGTVQNEGQFFLSFKVFIRRARDKKTFCVCICGSAVLLVCVPLQSPGEVLV